MKRNLILDQRELKEIKLNLYYMKMLAHGTDGHNLRLISAKFAVTLGFDLNEQGDLTYNDQPLPFGEGIKLNIGWDSESFIENS